MPSTTREAAARRIQRVIRRVLLEDWDPIGVREVPEAQDEYDSYVGGVYRLLAEGASARILAEHLYAIETDRMGKRTATAAHLLPVAVKLCSLNVRLAQESGAGEQ